MALLLEEAKQVDIFSKAQGAQFVYEIGRQVIYSGKPPWPLLLQDPVIKGPNGVKIVLRVQPYTQVAEFHTENAGNPIITAGNGANPQFSEALGVDFVSLVAQMLHDPGQNPPQPATSIGPAVLR